MNTEDVKVRVAVFTRGKSEERNEDSFGSNGSSFVLADGATDKSGRLYEGKSGGEIASELVVSESLAASLNGVELIEHLNEKLADLYKKLGIEDDMKDALFRFTCTLICARVIAGKIAITCVGDSGFRINGDFLHLNENAVNIMNAQERSEYIEKTGDVAGSRNHIMPLLHGQFEYQNSSDHPLGYGVVDGTSTPSRFVKVFEYDRDEIHTLEIFSDGYFAVPEETTIEAWERLNDDVEEEDPYKYKRYKSTKEKDDRTVAILAFDKRILH